MDWQPSSAIETLKARAKFLAQIRHFFAERDVVEVETPLLSHGTVTDVHMDAFESTYDFHVSGSPTQLYLQTSPEFAMKRLLAAGSGAIYQICKSFRNEESGRLHNPEFTMLEWYRPEFDDSKLMDELDELIQALLGCQSAIRLSYQQAFQQFLNIDPLAIEFVDLKAIVMSKSTDDWLQQEQDKDVLLQWLFSIFIEPQLGDEQTPCFVFDFPSSQASLAKTSISDPRVAHRFELYFQGIELANGFYELQDAKEQLKRFAKDNEQRLIMNKPCRPVDNNFIAALESGLPDCAGVAVGIDRLFMLQQKLNHIRLAMSFTVTNA